MDENVAEVVEAGNDTPAPDLQEIGDETPLVGTEVEVQSQPDGDSIHFDHSYPSPMKVQTSNTTTAAVAKPLSTNQASGLSCRVCDITHKTRQDKGKGVWIGCDVTACKYWCHARCVGYNVKSEDTIQMP